VSVQSSELGPPPFHRKRAWFLPLGTKWGEPHSLAEGGGGPNADDRTDTLVLYIVNPVRLKVTLSKELVPD
jgi:hypothetical protein